SNGTAQTTTINDVEATRTNQLFDDDHSFTIMASDPNSNILTIAENPGAVTPALTEGELLVYQGAIGTTSTLQAGQRYGVHITAQSDLNNIRIQLQDTVRLASLGTLTDSTHSFTLADVDSTTNTVTMSLDAGSSSDDLIEGQILVYHGANSAGF